MHKSEYRTKYLNFPLSFLQGIYDSKQHLGDICRWCIINYAQTINYKLEDVARQTMYFYYRQRNTLLVEIQLHLDDMVNEEKLDYDETYHGFCGPKFFPDTEIDQLLQEFSLDIDFQESCVLQYQYGIAMKLLNISGETIETALESYQKLNRFLAKFEKDYGKDVYTSIQTGVLFDARDGKIPVEMFAMLAAVKSIIGRRTFNKTSKGVVVSRMIGAKSNIVLAELLTNQKLYSHYSKYGKRYHFDKLMERTILRGFFLKIPSGRGFFVATKYTTPRAMYEAINLRKQRYDTRITDAYNFGKLIKTQNGDKKNKE